MSKESVKAATGTDAPSAEAPQANPIPASEEVVLVKMRRDYDSMETEVHPDGVEDYLRGGGWKIIK
jgi:hypothetical protein